jgi:hypothetical protein
LRSSTSRSICRGSSRRSWSAIEVSLSASWTLLLILWPFSHWKSHPRSFFKPSLTSQSLEPSPFPYCFSASAVPGLTLHWPHRLYGMQSMSPIPVVPMQLKL